MVCYCLDLLNHFVIPPLGSSLSLSTLKAAVGFPPRTCCIARSVIGDIDADEAYETYRCSEACLCLLSTLLCDAQIEQ